MSRDELRRAIERPAQRVGLSVEPELVDALLADVEGQPGALPLLSTALLELWRERDGRRLRLAAYARSGGVQGAVARLAEDAPSSARSRPAGDRAHAAAAARRRGRRRDRAPADRARGARERGAEVVDRLADRRLLTVSDGAVEVAHEALLREWPRLRGWLEEDAEGRRLHAPARRTRRAPGTPTAATPAGSTAARGWPPRSSGRPAHEAELNADRARVPRREPRASERAQRRLRLVLAGVASRCSSSR